MEVLGRQLSHLPGLQSWLVYSSITAPLPGINGLKPLLQPVLPLLRLFVLPNVVHELNFTQRHFPVSQKESVSLRVSKTALTEEMLTYIFLCEGD